MPKNAQTTAQLHSSHNASKVMLKILQARLQQYVNCELPDVQAGFRKVRGTRDQIANILWIMEKARVHPYGRKQRGTKEPLDEDKRGEWKSWLKTQHSKNEDHGIQPHQFMASRGGKNGNSNRL